MLTLKHLQINSFSENIAYAHRDCTAYKFDDIGMITKIEIHGGNRPVYAFLQIVDDETLVGVDEIGLNTEAFNQINLPEGANVTVTLSPIPPSLGYVKKKINGNIYSNTSCSVVFWGICSLQCEVRNFLQQAVRSVHCKCN